jgi:hypothetical protein
MSLLLHFFWVFISMFLPLYLPLGNFISLFNRAYPRSSWHTPGTLQSQKRGVMHPFFLICFEGPWSTDTGQPLDSSPVIPPILEFGMELFACPKPGEQVETLCRGTNSTKKMNKSQKKATKMTLQRIFLVAPRAQGFLHAKGAVLCLMGSCPWAHIFPKNGTIKPSPQ